MIDTGADYLVPGHTRPVLGSANVRAGLTSYRDGIKSVFDQTLAGMRDELVGHVTLPPTLADSPYLQEFYGTVAWSVRAIYAEYAGWFDGNPAKLFPLPEQDRAVRVIELAGGQEPVMARARRALTTRSFSGPPSWPTTCSRSTVDTSRPGG